MLVAPRARGARAVMPRASVGHAGERVRARAGRSGRATREGIERSARSGWRGRPAQPRASISSSPGTRSVACSPSGGGTSRPSGSGSSSTLRISLPETPSTTEWWTLVSSADLAALEAVDQVELPQRAVAVQRAGEDARDRLGELRGRRRAAAPPTRGCGSPGRSRGPRSSRAGRARTAPRPASSGTAAAGGCRSPSRRQTSRDLDRSRRAPSRVVDRQRADVAVDPRGLHRQELRVKARQLPHVTSSRWTGTSCVDPCPPGGPPERGPAYAWVTVVLNPNGVVS